MPARLSSAERADLIRRARTVWRDAVRALWDGFRRFYSSNDLTHASSIAYFALLSLFPGVMLMLALLGQLTAYEGERTAVVSFFLRYFPTQFEFLTRQLDALRGQRVRLGLAGGLLAIWATLGVFGAITTAMNSAWQVERQPSYLRHKLVSFLMLLAAALLTFIGLLVVSVQNVIGASWFAAVLTNAPALGVMRGLLANGATLMGFVLVTGLIFYYVPNTRVRFRDVWIGALLTGVLWRLALAGFSWYVRDLSRFSIHGSIAAVVVFLFWVYLWAVILMYGAEFTVAYAALRARQRSPVPEEDAPVRS